MVNTYTSGLEEKLRQAEDAADEVSRLAALASQAPLLRAEVARVQRQEERDANRKNAIEQAKRAVAAAAKKQHEVPATIETDGLLPLHNVEGD